MIIQSLIARYSSRRLQHSMDVYYYCLLQFFHSFSGNLVEYSFRNESGFLTRCRWFYFIGFFPCTFPTAYCLTSPNDFVCFSREEYTILPGSKVADRSLECDFYSLLSRLGWLWIWRVGRDSDSRSWKFHFLPDSEALVGLRVLAYPAPNSGLQSVYPLPCFFQIPDYSRFC